MTNLKAAIRDYLLLDREPSGTLTVSTLAAHYRATEAEIVGERNEWRRLLRLLVRDRIYYQGVPVGAGFPRVQILQIGTDAVQCLMGPAGLTKSVMLLDAQSEGSQDESDQVASVVRRLLQGVSGEIGAEAVLIDSIEMIDDQDDKNPPRANEDAVFRDFQTFEVWYYDE